jgi:hypothetical protein
MKENLNICPFVNHPFNGCYCVDMNSGNVISALELCNNNFTNCKYYIKAREIVIDSIGKNGTTTTDSLTEATSLKLDITECKF